MPKRKTVKSRRLFTFVVVILVTTILVTYTKNRVGAKTISPIPDEQKTSAFFQLFAKKKKPEELRQKIRDKVGNKWKNYSIYVVNFTSDFSMGINESVIFTAASVNKIPILATLYRNAQEGGVDFDNVITLQQSDIQDYGTGSIRYDPAGTTYTVKTLARLMMQKSDNTAAFLLGNYVVGLDKVQRFMDSLGLTQTDIVNNKTSNKDMAILLADIYDGKITNQAYTQEMLAFMKDSDFEDRLPANLPKTATVYHKIGTGTGTVHDVGVVVDGDTKYYIGIFTSDITDEEQASKLAAEVSRLVYDFMK